MTGTASASAPSATRYPVPPGIQASPGIVDKFQTYGPSYKWLATLTVMLSSLSTFLAVTIVNVTIPDIMSAFAMDQTQAQWLSSSYLAATTLTMLLTAWAAHTFGIRNTAGVALTVFTLGSLTAGFAENKEVLILARVMQGSAAGLIPPLAMLVIFQVFPINRRSTAMGIYGIGAMLGPAIGPSLGGLLIEYFNWRYVFFVLVPISAVCLPMSLLYLPGKEEGRRKMPFDFAGTALLALTLIAAISALSSGQRLGWGSDFVVLTGAAGAISALVFLWWESETPNPMLDLSLFRHSSFAAAAIVSLVLGVGLYASTYLMPLFLQTLQGMTAAQAGNLLLLPGLIMAFVFPVAGRIGDTVEPRYLIIFGLLLFAWSSWWLGFIDINTPYLAMGFWLLIGRAGLGCIFPCMNAAALASLPFEKLSEGSGTINFLRQLGGAMGVNIMSIYFSHQQAVYQVELELAQVPNATTLETLDQIQRLLPGLPQHERLLVSFGDLVARLTGQAATLAFRDAFMLIALLFLLTCIPAWFMRARAQAS